MFAAALIYSAKSVELSIYSTCKRISQKLLRNVQKFLSLIYEGLGVPPFKELRCNMEEIVLQGPDGAADVRIVNSYPSKVITGSNFSSFYVLLLAQRNAVVEVLRPDRLVLESTREVARLSEVLFYVVLSCLVEMFFCLFTPQHTGKHGLQSYFVHVLVVILYDFIGDFLDEPHERRAGDALRLLAAIGALLHRVC